jgi:hypothetical protein
MLASGKSIENKSKIIEELWRNLNSSLSRIDTYEALAYSFFLSGVRNSPFDSVKVLADCFKSKENMLRKNKFQTIYDNILNDSNSFTIFVQKDFQGIEKITFASDQISILGYTASEIKNKLLNIIVPKAMKLSANFDFIGYVENIYRSMVHRHFPFLLQTQDEHIVSAEIYICPLLSVRDQFSYILIVNAHQLKG